MITLSLQLCCFTTLSAVKLKLSGSIVQLSFIPNRFITSPIVVLAVMLADRHSTGFAFNVSSTMPETVAYGFWSSFTTCTW